ncbi:MAG: nitroreductase family protein [Proteobacteria bacterium]|nr:nitroreductase family protein [Pseudomonadota bacterium]MBU4276035.1 nitroreductase family protein [Pseudomonadota bacterium]MBU4384070.1 nitroreductase family protein [Pseudomonadota bacterium]MBU4604319.1 nitroreductase family protein [Pseudomonadota bacterium]MCG2763709.1 nitroreductase family protein [Desulfarculaceae bacterium]
MELMEAIQQRRSIRKFEDRPVSDELVRELMDAVMWSPSWANTQCWELVQVKDPAKREQLQQTISKGNPATKTIVSAPALFVVCGRLKSSGYYNGVVTTKFGDWFMFDLGIACQSLCLAAHAKGLGSVIVGLFDHDAAGKVIDLPEGHEVVAMVPMGYPAQEVKAPKRRPPEEFLRVDSF